MNENTHYRTYDHHRKIVWPLLTAVLVAGGLYAGMVLERSNNQPMSTPDITYTPKAAPQVNTTNPNQIDESKLPQNNQAATPPASSAQSATWKTYTNPRVFYSFKYPTTGLTMPLDETHTYPSETSGSDKNSDLVQFATKDHSYSVQAKVNIEIPTIEKWLETTYDRNEYQKITVGGEAAYKYKDRAYVHVIKNNILYEISAHGGVAPIDFNDPIYQQLLKSFTFTK